MSDLWIASAGFTLLAGLSAAPAAGPAVEVEEVVTSYENANNGAGPLWCYGSTCVARLGETVFASAIETGKDVPPLCNTRWQLWHRSPDGWKLAQHEKDYRQREPCPMAIFPAGPVFLSVNPSTQPPATQYGECRPLVLEFDPRRPTEPPKVNEPVFAEGTNFTDHSYRGFAADGEMGELLLLNVNARTGAYFVSHRDRDGAWHARGTIEFPIRACYPQVHLRGGAAHVLAIGDIVEPVEEWRKLKFEKLQRQWDYVFRRLFYTYTPDIAGSPFITPVEVDTVEKTAGHISNLDLHVDRAGAAHLLYMRRPHQYEFIRDKYFPGEPMTSHLEHMVLKEGRIVSRRTLAENPAGPAGLAPSFARFHAAPGGQLHAIVAGTITDDGGNSAFGNWIAPMPDDGSSLAFKKLELKHPFGSFFTNTPRGGSQPSDIIDLFGTTDEPLTLRYARVRLR